MHHSNSTIINPSKIVRYSAIYWLCNLISYLNPLAECLYCIMDMINGLTYKVDMKVKLSI